MLSGLELVLFGKGKWRTLRHLLFWVFVYFDEVLFTFLDAEGFQDLDFFFIPIALDIIMVYLNLYLLIPKFLNQKKYPFYIIATLATIAVNVALVSGYAIIRYGEGPYLEGLAATFIATATLLATAVAIKVGKYSYEQLKYTEQLKSEQSKLELNYLKQQINPHFLFNVLNTIHIQSLSNPSAVSDTVLHLSDLLRYQIYEAGASETVALSKEIDFLKNYVSLEELRRTNLTVSWTEDATLPKFRVTPFLFLPLIENAFKHSRSINEIASNIDISWLSDDRSITLKVSNTIGDTHEKEEGGFGIDNLEKRLELLYPDKHHLEMGIHEGQFISSLKISLG